MKPCQLSLKFIFILVLIPVLKPVTSSLLVPCLTKMQAIQFFSSQASVKGLEVGGLDILSVTDVTPVPHNGCRPRKVRRM